MEIYGIAALEALSCSASQFQPFFDLSHFWRLSLNTLLCRRTSCSRGECARPVLMGRVLISKTVVVSDQPIGFGFEGSTWPGISSPISLFFIRPARLHNQKKRSYKINSGSCFTLTWTALLNLLYINSISYQAYQQTVGQYAHTMHSLFSNIRTSSVPMNSKVKWLRSWSLML